METQRTQILYSKYSSCAGIPLAEGMYLPYAGDEPCQMANHFVLALSFVRFLLAKIRKIEQNTKKKT
jgi:hypothetical protein